MNETPTTMNTTTAPNQVTRPRGYGKNFHPTARIEKTSEGEFGRTVYHIVADRVDGSRFPLASTFNFREAEDIAEQYRNGTDVNWHRITDADEPCRAFTLKTKRGQYTFKLTPADFAPGKFLVHFQATTMSAGDRWTYLAMCDARGKMMPTKNMRVFVTSPIYRAASWVLSNIFRGSFQVINAHGAAVWMERF